LPGPGRVTLVDRIGSVLTPRFLPYVVVFALAATTGRAMAQDADEYRYRKTHRQAYESRQRFAFELRLGPYRPNIDDAFPTAKPYESVFGSSKRVFVGLEFDWQVARIPMVGTIGPGFGLGYTHMSAQATLLGTNEPAAEETTLALMPTYGVGVLRVDVLARETAIPLVGYAKAGLGCGFFKTGNDLGTQAKGHTWGMHYALGGMFLLDSLDQYAAAQLDNEMGINNTYIYVEWMLSKLDNFGHGKDRSVMNVGTNTWMMGLAFEM
jgi:hypothetical protein